MLRPVLCALSVLALSPVVCAQVAISPGTSIQSVIDKHSAGTTYVLQAGTHREQQITPKTGDTFQGEMSGSTRLTILSGARVLSSWTPSGGRWYATGQTQQGTTGEPRDCLKTHPQCIYPEDLWFDNVLKFREASLAATGVGEWYFDYAADRIYVGDDPTGHVVETSVKEGVFLPSSADNVTIKDMIVEKYAGSSNGVHAAVNIGYSVRGAEGWLATNLEVRYNHYAGIGNDLKTTATNNYVHHNCNSGFFGAGPGVLIADNEIAYNGIAPGYIGSAAFSNPCGFSPYWGSGGSKWVYTTGLIVRGNYSHHNYGAGLWTDINNVDVLYENNIVEDNFRSGIFHEISYSAVIRNNVLRRNGVDTTFGDYPTNACIEVLSSPGVEIFGNTCVDNSNGIAVWDDTRNTGAHGSLAVVNTYVHDNRVFQQGSQPGFNGLVNTVDDSPTGAPFQPGAKNRWENNLYCLTGGRDPYFRWRGADLTLSQWKAQGLDVNSPASACTQEIEIRSK
jgi:hypothetical protein